jgi:anti-sigma factor (TIGR02949 family)
VDCNEIQDLITAEIDGELAEESKAPLREHLSICPKCKAEYELELSTKAFLRRRLQRAETPSLLRQQITTELAAMSPSGTGFRDWLEWFGQLTARRSSRVTLALGSALAVILILLMVTPSKPRHLHTSPDDANIIHQAYNNFDGLLAGTLSPQVSSDDPAVIRNFFASRVNFNVNCPKHKRFKLVGGGCSKYNNEPVANVVYKKGRDIIYLYEANYRCVANGAHLNLPPEALSQLRTTGWYVENHQPDCTLAIWLVDSTVCCAIADMSQDNLLAFLKDGE